MEETKKVTATSTAEVESKKPFKFQDFPYEFCLYINESLICRRNFAIPNFIEESMQTLEFKDCVDRVVELIQDDLKSKSRVYVWYHNVPEFPDWEPEVMTSPLVDEGTNVFKFVILYRGKEVISRAWDGRYYPKYVRKTVDLTNRQVKIFKKDETAYIYDKNVFFEENGDNLYGDLYMLKGMIMDKEDLVPKIQNLIIETCSSNGGYFDAIDNYQNVATYKGKDGKVRKYNLNIRKANSNYIKSWERAVAKKTQKYFSSFPYPLNSK